MKTTTWFLCLLLSGAMAAKSQDLVVQSIDRAGRLVFTPVTNAGMEYRIEWASSAAGPWGSSWTSLVAIQTAGMSPITTKVPMVYRVVAAPISTPTPTPTRTPTPTPTSTSTPTPTPTSTATPTPTPTPTPSSNMRLVAAGGQPQGPQYNFYMSKYEVTNDEFCEFLNDAQANLGNERGAFMFFSDSGDVYIRTNNSSLIMFKITSSRLLYNPSSAIGSRYSVYVDYIGHPIVGGSWYGALKYCNWLSIHEGRSINQRCYKEGPETTNWYPANITFDQWSTGFSDIERLQWVQNYTGYRLPMDHLTEAANYYNEFYKAAAWTGVSNTVYSFGRSIINTQDANYANSKDPFEAYAVKTTPAGYYDGSNHGGTFQTRSNANYWGIYDLSGNVEEWTTDGFNGNYSPERRGGSWYVEASQCTANYRDMTNPYDTFNYRGFRVVSSAP